MKFPSNFKNMQNLIDIAYKQITRIKGKEYAPSVHEIQEFINNYLKH